MEVKFGILVLLIALASALCPSEAQTITLFEHNDHQGESISLHVNGNNCINMPHEWNDRTSSINSHGQCFLIYEHANCDGQLMKIQDGAPSIKINEGRCLRHNSLSDCQYRPFYKWFLPSFKSNIILMTIAYR